MFVRRQVKDICGMTAMTVCYLQSMVYHSIFPCPGVSQATWKLICHHSWFLFWFLFFLFLLLFPVYCAIYRTFDA